MRKIIALLGISLVILASCTTTAPIKKSVAYKGMYSEKPVTILLMPPINRSTNVEAKESFHTTLNVSLVNQGFYVVPPFLSMEILKKESAYDAELFLTTPLAKFGEIFGADVALFTIIHKWEKSGFNATVKVEVEYILKSTKTNEILYTRRGEIVYDASIRTNGGGLAGLAIGMAISAANTAATKYVDVAKICNVYTFKDLPVGKYSPLYNLDGEELAGDKTFKARVNSSIR